ncbi:uncharacterized protein METZ01_LOCUS508421, partial [marine metagenome]
MLSSQQQIISFVASRLESNNSVWLCTILKTWGSSPRPVGAMMACTPGGELVGSLSGGCIEEDFLHQLREGSLKSQCEITGRPFTVRYGETEEEQARLQLPCGGQLHVLLEYNEPSDASKQVFSYLASSLENHTKVSRTVDLETGEISAADNDCNDALVIEGSKMIHSLSPMYRLLLLGAG